ncbi:MAG: hypothetical protein RLP02_35485 [Coleofasciculus sp. C2-GNP5-27]|uniref:hypothetical protein n=1 Tax=Coleofasciculus sp. B1-GNL1-01 TaxID=3068484 RepID=UPI0032FF8C56
MEANLNSTLGDLKQIIQHLSISERWVLLKWLVELLQQEPYNQQKENIKINFSAVHQICDEIRSLPVLDNRSPEEIIGYNEFGGLD